MLDDGPASSSELSSTGQSRRSLLLSITELLALADPEWLIEGILPQGSLAVLYGPPGAGKSFLALDWSMSVDQGRKWSGRQVRRGTATYICAEGTSGLKQRVRAWLAVVSPEAKGLLFYPKPLDIGSADDRQPLIGELRERGAEPSLIVIDTLNRCFGGLDENSTADMTQFVRGLDDLRSQFPEATILVVHHSGKDKARGERGSTVLRAAADTVVRLDKQGRTITLKCEKQKDGEEFEEVLLTLETIPLGGDQSSCVLRPAGKDSKAGRQRDSVDPRAAKTDEIMLDALAKLGGQARSTAWLKATGRPRSTFQDSKNRLLAANLVTNEGAVYRLADEGRKAGRGPAGTGRLGPESRAGTPPYRGVPSFRPSPAPVHPDARGSQVEL
jgi:RecA-family ATPase